MSEPTVADPMIEVSGVRKAFGETKALDGVDLQVPPATVLGLTAVFVIPTQLLAAYVARNVGSSELGAGPSSGVPSASTRATSPAVSRS